jgi:hypothetical protein
MDRSIAYGGWEGFSTHHAAMVAISKSHEIGCHLSRLGPHGLTTADPSQIITTRLDPTLNPVDFKLRENPPDPKAPPLALQDALSAILDTTQSAILGLFLKNG